MSLRRVPKTGAHSCGPALYRMADYGLELTDECGTAIGPSACCSSDRPMHWPELPPVHGMPLISGSPPGEVWPASGEFGTRSGTHSPVTVSSDSPPGHAAIVGAELVRYGDDGDPRGDRDSERKSAGKDQSSCRKLQGRNLRAFGSCCQVAEAHCRCPPSHLLLRRLRRMTRSRCAIVNKSGAPVPILQLAVASVAPLHGHPPWHRNVHCSLTNPSERGGPLWQAPI
jgi:hypothetical protein